MGRKVRLVPGWHRQQKEINYDETFATSAWINSIHIVLAVTVQCNWEIDQVDMVVAYLNSTIDEEVFMEPPHGLLKSSDDGRVCQLLKAVYGLLCMV
jgi:hypothetical protein